MKENKFKIYLEHPESDCKFNEYFDIHEGLPPHDYSEINIICIVQYIGLKDRNKKEIYEHDILKFYDKNGEFYGKDKFFCFGYCYFNELGSFVHTFHEVHDDKIEYDSQRPPKRFWNKDIYEYEVIGNIHENPELLKGIEK
jgi:uncharacterized phage protein (TIGR01671 family)